MEARIGNAAYRVGERVVIGRPDDCNNDWCEGERATVTEVFAFRDGVVIPMARWTPQPGDDWGYALVASNEPGRTGNFYGEEIAGTAGQA